MNSKTLVQDSRYSRWEPVARSILITWLQDNLSKMASTETAECNQGSGTWWSGSIAGKIVQWISCIKVLLSTDSQRIWTFFCFVLPVLWWFVSCFQQMLAYEPSKRISAMNSLQHPYFKNVQLLTTWLYPTTPIIGDTWCMLDDAVYNYMSSQICYCFR